jgi:hypothetical protein
VFRSDASVGCCNCAIPIFTLPLVAAHSHITFVVGRGNHSVGGVGVIGWKVREYLGGEGVPFCKMNNGGALVIGLDAFL